VWDKRDKRVIFLFQYYIHTRETSRKQMRRFSWRRFSRKRMGGFSGNGDFFFWKRIILIDLNFDHALGFAALLAKNCQISVIYS